LEIDEEELCRTSISLFFLDTTLSGYQIPDCLLGLLSIWLFFLWNAFAFATAVFDSY